MLSGMDFRVDIYASDDRTVVRFFTADRPDDALDVARGEVIALGFDAADVWQLEAGGSAVYVGNVRVEQ